MIKNLCIINHEREKKSYNKDINDYFIIKDRSIKNLILLKITN